ncbi:MAG: DNA internalization-related competence protein ComEC/Rec2 [Anaerococcus sp.]
MRKNLLFILLGVLSGIGIFIVDRGLGFYIFVLSLILSLIFYCYKKTLIFLSIGLMFGFFYSYYLFNSYELLEKDNRNLELTIVEKKQKEEFFTYTVLAKDIEDGVKEKSVFTDESDFNIGDKLFVKAKINLPKTNTNPYLFSYRKYLLSENVKSSLDIKKIYGFNISHSFLLSIKNKFYNYIHEIFDSNMNKESANFVTSVILGESLIDSDEIRDLGLSHILAVSGLHIDILVSFILLIFTYLNVNYSYGFLTALGLCFLYGYLISFPYSVIRVLIMTLIKYLAFVLRKPEDKKKSLLIAGLAILLINPFAVLSPGYILTFSAATGIYLIYPKIKHFGSNSFIKKQVIFSIAIQIAIFPFIIYYYGKINLMSLFANLIVVPIFELSMYIIFGLIVLFPLLGKILKFVFWILDFLIGQILEVTKFLAYFSIFSFEFKKESIVLSIFFFVFVLVLIYGSKKNKIMNKLYFGISIIIIGFLAIEPIFISKPSFSMVDIGQGDAFILKDGKDIYLFDVGGPKFDSYDSGEKILVPLLKSMGVREIKAIFISHLDKDHAGNLEIVNRNFKVKNVISTPLNSKELAAYNFLPMSVGDKIRLKNGYIEAVFDGVDGENKNNNSLGLLIDIKGNKVLTLGDLESNFEDKLNVRADILKISHHGSKTSTSKKFVEKIDPNVTLISAGRNNTYGHPSKEVLENISNTKIYNTQENGFVEIRFLENGSYQIEPYLKGDFF